MHSKFIFAISIIFPFLMSEAAVNSFYEGGRSNSYEVADRPRVVKDEDLKKYIDLNIQQIEKTLTRLPTAKSKLDFIQDRVQRVSEYRSLHWSKSAYVEQQLDLAIKPFESFPKANEFKSDRCTQYLNAILVDWEPGAANGRPSQAGVARAYKILSDICQ